MAEQNGTTTGKCAEEYVVKRGDSFYLIAHKLGVPLRDLLAANRDIHPARLMVGDVLCVPREEDDSPQTGGLGGSTLSQTPGTTSTQQSTGTTQVTGMAQATQPTGTSSVHFRAKLNSTPRLKVVVASYNRFVFTATFWACTSGIAQQASKKININRSFFIVLFYS